jgi:hypothetical protein
MGRRFEEFKSRMRLRAQIGEIETEIADHESFITTNPDSHPLRMLKSAVAAMKANLADLRQAHRQRFGRRFAK